MRLIAIIVLAAAQLGGGFGSGSAEIEELGEASMIVDIEVEVRVSSDAVVAHLSFDGDPTLTIPLLERDGGVFGARTELEPKNYAVVFEAVGSSADLSEPRTLAQLGADFDGDPGGADSAPTAAGSEEGLSPETQRLGWLALALGAASLSVLAIWVLGGRDDRAAGETESTEEVTEEV